MKKLIIGILICWVMACTLFLILSYKSASSEKASTAATLSGSEARLQSQINDLSNKISSFNEDVSKLKSQENVTGTSTVSYANQQVSSQIDVITANAKKLTIQVNSLSTQIAELQDKLKTAGTMIGAAPVTVNGLSVVFITNDIEIGMTGSSSPSIAQFAVKIMNTTSSALTNVDVTGTIRSSEYYPDDILASGYPQLTDGAGLCTYVYFIKNGDLHFEAFGNAKTSLSIPAGGSITLRPKIAVLAVANDNLPSMTFKIALETITFDKIATK
jgi:hypothetical protein